MKRKIEEISKEEEYGDVKEKNTPSKKRKIDTLYLPFIVKHKEDLNKRRKECEKYCGISKFLTTENYSVEGNVKVNPYDFHVHEIFDGKIVRLTDTNKLVKKIDPEKLAAQKGKENAIIELSSLIPGFQGEEITKFRTFLKTQYDPKIEEYERMSNRERKRRITAELKKRSKRRKNRKRSKKGRDEQEQEGKEKEEKIFYNFPGTPEAKDDRKKVHLLLRENFKLISSKLEDIGDNKRVIQAYYDEFAARSNKKRSFSKDTQYTECVVYKYNCTTRTAISLMNERTRIPNKAFTYNGLKDKVACTTQLMRIFKTDDEKLFNFSESTKKKELPNEMKIRLGNYKYVPKGFNIGELDGNFFDIVLRDVVVNSKIDEKLKDAEIINKICSQVKETGFINYFGMQRFGTRELKTFQFGIEVLKQNWQGVINMYLHNIPALNDEIKDAIEKFWKERNYDETIAVFDKYKGTFKQKSLLYGLKNDGDNAYKNVFDKKIQRNIRSLYIHSYQSLIWNRVVSKRIELYGLKPVVGDIVFKDPKRDKNEKSPEILFLTEDNVKNYSIYDILIPVPGADVVYPKNQINKSVYEDLLKQDGLELSCFISTKKQFNTFGNYRNILCKPKMFSWKIIPYNDNSQQLVKSDLDILEGKELDLDVDMDNKEKKLGLVLSFDLQSGSYATMMIREITKGTKSIIL